MQPAILLWPTSAAVETMSPPASHSVRGAGPIPFGQIINIFSERLAGGGGGARNRTGVQRHVNHTQRMSIKSRGGVTSLPARLFLPAWAFLVFASALDVSNSCDASS